MAKKSAAANGFRFEKRLSVAELINASSPDSPGMNLELKIQVIPPQESSPGALKEDGINPIEVIVSGHITSKQLLQAHIAAENYGIVRKMAVAEYQKQKKQLSGWKPEPGAGGEAACYDRISEEGKLLRTAREGSEALFRMYAKTKDKGDIKRAVSMLQEVAGSPETNLIFSPTEYTGFLQEIGDTVKGFNREDYYFRKALIWGYMVQTLDLIHNHGHNDNSARVMANKSAINHLIADDRRLKTYSAKLTTQLYQELTKGK